MSMSVNIEIAPSQSVDKERKLVVAQTAYATPFLRWVPEEPGREGSKYARGLAPMVCALACSEIFRNHSSHDATRSSCILDHLSFILQFYLILQHPFFSIFCQKQGVKQGVNRESRAPPSLL